METACLVRNELQAGSVGIEYLAATSDEAWRIGSRLESVAEPDIGRVGLCLRELPGDSAGFAVQRNPKSPHHATAAWIRKSPVTHDLDRNSTHRTDGLHVVMKVK